MFKRLKLPEINILSLAIIALLLFIPLYPKFPLFNVPGTYVAIRIEDLLVGGIVIIWLLIEIFRGFPSLRDRVGQLVLLFWAIGGLSLLSACLITQNVVPHLVFLHWLRRIEYMSLFFVALASVKKRENLRSYGFTLFLATIGVAAYGIGQKFLGWPVVSTMNREFSKGMLLQLAEWARINSTFAGHYDLAAFLVLVLPLAAGFVVGLRRKVVKIMVAIVGLLAFYILILTASRVSFVAYLIALTLVLVSLKKYWWVGPVLTFSLAAMMLSADISQRYAHTFNIDLSALSSRIPRRERVAEIALMPTPTPTPLPKETKVVPGPGGPVKITLPTLTPTPTATPTAVVEEWKPTTEVAVEYSSGIRFHVEWPRAIRAFLKNPLLGTGYSSVTLATDNDYLRLLAETGLLGFAAFGLIFLEIGRRIMVYLQEARPALERALVAGVAGAAIGLFANAVFIDVFEASKVAFVCWMWMGILVGAMKLKSTRRTQ